MLLFAGILIFVAMFGLIATPATMGTMGGPSGWETVLPIHISDLPTVLGLGGMLVGLGWMWKIYRAPTRFEGAHWRFHDH